ncbi:MAG: GntR family transcriptional regulator [Rubrivivax sp.]|nr:GntR family transcriptional regulator [Rubrivivax sp.]
MPPARHAAKPGPAAHRAAGGSGATGPRRPTAPRRGAAGRRAAGAVGAGGAGGAGSGGGPGEGDGSATQRIVDAITAAIVERRLMPGTKLAEQQLADLFTVSRTIVRQALNRLSRDRLITLAPARGAFVAQPSIEEARQVFEVRRLLEVSMVRQLCAVVTDDQVAELRRHLKHEGEAVARTDVTGRTRLLADFHVVLARMLGNEVLAQLLADLLARCSLVALMYQSAHSAGHSAEEHVAIVDAIEHRDARAAARLMESHLGHVERNLQLHPRVSDLASALKMI